MSKLKLTVLLGLCALSAVAQAQSVVLPSVLSYNDKVLVNRGGQYLPITPETTLQASDKLMVLDGGEVTVGCPGEPLVSFKTTGAYDLPACKQAVAQNAAAAAAAAQPAPTGTTAATAGATEGGVSGGTKVALGVAAAAVVVGVAASSGGGDDGGSSPPVSP